MAGWHHAGTMRDMTPRPRALVNARIAGLLYLVLIVTGLFSQIVLTGVTVPGDPAATAANIVDDQWLYRIAFVASIALILCEAVLTIILYYLLRPVSAVQSLLAAVFRLVSLPIYAAALLFMYAALVAAAEPDGPASLALFFLDLHTYGYAVGLTFFALNCFVMGRLLYRSSHAPRALGILLSIAGAGYLLNSVMIFTVPGASGSASAILLVPALIAEIWFCGLLLCKGGGIRQWAEPARPPMVHTGPIPGGA